MIYSITLNPALDCTIWVDKIKSDEPNSIEKEARFAGGKGIDVSKVLTTLGLPNRALGFVGGFAGGELEDRHSWKKRAATGVLWPAEQKQTNGAKCLSLDPWP